MHRRTFLVSSAAVTLGGVYLLLREEAETRTDTVDRTDANSRTDS